MNREQLLDEIKYFAPGSDAERFKELVELLTKRAALQYPDSTFGDDNARKCFLEGIRFTIQAIFGGFR